MIYIYMLAYLQGLKFGVKFGGIASSPASATFVRWLRELNSLQLQKTHANRKSTSKSGKHLHQFDSRWCKCSQHIVVSICSVCVVKLTKVVFLICRRFFLFAVRFFLGCVVSICSMCVVKLRNFQYFTHTASSFDSDFFSSATKTLKL